MNPNWTEDRKNYDHVSPLHENLRKSAPKATTKVQTTIKEDRKLKILNFKG